MNYKFIMNICKFRYFIIIYKSLNRKLLIYFCINLYFQGQLEDHGPFKYLSKLWGHHAHLAVFINYVLSTNDLSSLVSRNYNYLFLLIQKFLVKFFKNNIFFVTVILFNNRSLQRRECKGDAKMGIWDTF